MEARRRKGPLIGPAPTPYLTLVLLGNIIDVIVHFLRDDLTLPIFGVDLE